MRQWSRLAAVCCAAGLLAAATGCGQLFASKGTASQPTLQDLAQRVDQLEAQVSELNAAMAGGAQGQAATSSAAGANAFRGGAAAAGGPAAGAPQAVVTASYLNVHPKPDVTTPRVGVLKRNTVVSVLGTEGIWTQVDFNHLQGWVESQYLKKPGQTGAGTASTNRAGAAKPSRTGPPSGQGSTAGGADITGSGTSGYGSGSTSTSGQ